MRRDRKEKKRWEMNVLILVVLIGLVIVFKKNINTLLESIFKQINSSAKQVY